MRLLIIFFSLVVGYTCYAQENQTPINKDYISQLIKGELQNWNVAGASICIVKNGAVIYNEGFGFRDPQGTKKVTPNTLFAMGSSAKPFTGALIAEMHIDSLLNIKEPVSPQVPIAFNNPNLTDEITFIDMLTHTTGIPGHDFVWLAQDIDRGELWNRVRYLPETTDLRQSFQYNNIIYSLAGYAAAKLAGKDWESAIQDLLFEPLEMQRTQFEIPTVQNSSDFSVGFIYNGSIHVPLPFRDLEIVAPAGGVYTNSTDISKWVQMLLSEGQFKGKQVLDSLTIKKIFQPYVVSTFPRKFEEHFYENYGLGWMITNYRGFLHVHHTGNIDGFSSTIDLWPEQELGLVILTNTLAANSFTDVIKYEILDHLLELDDVRWSDRYKNLKSPSMKDTNLSSVRDSLENMDYPISDINFDRYTGVYSHKAYGTIKLTSHENKLTGSFNNFKLSLVPKAPLHFSDDQHFKGQKFEFKEGESGNIVGLKTLFPSSVESIEFTLEKINH